MAARLAIPLLAVAFLVGVWRWRLFIAEAMQRLAMRLRGASGRPSCGRALAEEFDDPTLEFVHRRGRPWVDVTGEEIPVPEATAEQALTEIFDGGQRVAAILHDPALSEDAAFTATATAYALMTLESERLAAQTDRLLSEVREARMRARSAAEEERRRIEHDLHDGAQQRLDRTRGSSSSWRQSGPRPSIPARRSSCGGSEPRSTRRWTRSARSHAAIYPAS